MKYPQPAPRMRNWPALLMALVLRGAITAKGSQYVLNVASSPPSRRPSNACGRNLLVDIASAKMGHTMQVESLHLEAAYALFLEIAIDCVGYWSQPQKLPIPCTDRNGHRRTLWLTFDFLVLYCDRVELIECKMEEEAVKLSQKFPGRYHRNANGDWRAPEIEAALEEYGIKFRIVTSKEINPTLLRNYTLLQEAKQSTYSSPVALDVIRNCLPHDANGASLSDVLAKAGAEFTKNDVYFGLLRGDLHALLDKCLLVDAKVTRIFRSAAHADLQRSLLSGISPEPVQPIVLKPGVRVRWNETEYTVCNASREKIYVRLGEGEPISIAQTTLCRLIESGDFVILGEVAHYQAADVPELAKFGRVLSQEKISDAVTKQQFLAFRQKEPSALPEHFGLKGSLRSIQRWCAAAKESLARYGTSFWGLIAAVRPGRPRDDLPPDMREDMTRFANELYFSPEKRSLAYVWRAIRDHRKTQGLRWPSPNTLRSHVQGIGHTLFYLATPKDAGCFTPKRCDDSARHAFGQCDSWSQLC